MGLLDFLQTPQGQALASGVATYAAGARRGTPVNNIGRGLLGGLTSYADQQAQAEAQKIKSMQMQQMQMQMEQMKKAQERQNQWESSVQGAFTPKFEQVPFGQQQEAQLAEQISSFPDFQDAAKKTNEAGSYAQMQTGMEFDPMKLKSALPFAPPGIQDEIIKSTFGMGADARTAEQKNWEYAQKLPPEMRSAFLAKSGGSAPATVQEWEFYNKLPPKEQGMFLEMKRNPQIMNLGGSQGVRAPGGGIGESYPVTPKPEQMPGFQGEQERAKSEAKAQVELKADTVKKGKGADALVSYANEAESILNKGAATGSLLGTGAAAMKGAVGYSDQSTKDNQRLKLISGWMVANVPRMEGPQSNYDVQNYREMAAMVGDTTIPIGDRIEAVKQLKGLQEKYKNIQTGTQDMPTQKAVPKFGERKNGYYYKGGDPASPTSWVKVKP